MAAIARWCSVGRSWADAPSVIVNAPAVSSITCGLMFPSLGAFGANWIGANWITAITVEASLAPEHGEM
jgi:hypothetical protein